VAKTGSLSAAARMLGATQPTVGRRIAAVETALGARLFERTQTGYQITEAGRGVFDAAQAIENNAWIITNRVAGEDHRPEGKVRLATSEGLGNCWVPDRLPRFRERYPGIQLEIAIATDFLDLLRRQADIALRIGRPGSDELVGRRLGEVAFGLYASTQYLAARGVPHCFDELADHAIIDTSGSLAEVAQARQLRACLKQMQVRLLTNCLITQLAAVRAGIGVAALPNYVTSGDTELSRILAQDFDVRLDLWLLTHRELKFSARIRAVWDFLIEQATGDEPLISGH
jgi:DNA-binding transcriptional LysR family regulator